MGKNEIAIDGFDTIITEAVETQVKLAIVEALEGSKDAMLERIIDQAMHAKVKDNYREIEFIEKLSRDALREAASQAMKEWVIASAPVIRAELERQMGTVKWRRTFAAAVLNGIVNRMESSWWDLGVTFNEQKDSD